MIVSVTAMLIPFWSTSKYSSADKLKTVFVSLSLHETIFSSEIFSWNFSTSKESRMVLKNFSIKITSDKAKIKLEGVQIFAARKTLFSFSPICAQNGHK